MAQQLTAALVALARRVAAGGRRLWPAEAGEGVISTAIAVLVIAFLGVGMWLGFSRIFTTAESNIETQVEQIGG